MCQMHEPEGWVHWKASKFKQKCIILSQFSSTNGKNVVINLILTQHKQTFAFQYVIIKTFYSLKTVLNVTYKIHLCWVQTSLPLRRVIIAWCFIVAALSGHAALALSPSGISPEFNRIQLSAICHVGQSGKVIDLLAWRCLPLGHPLRQVALAQLYKNRHQSGNATSGKLVWKQHYPCSKWINPTRRSRAIEDCVFGVHCIKGMHVHYFCVFWVSSIQIKDLRGNPKPRVSPDRTGPDRTETGPGSENIFKNIFGSGRVGEFYFGSVRVGEFYFGSVRVVGVFFLPGYETFSTGISG